MPSLSTGITVGFLPRRARATPSTLRNPPSIASARPERIAGRSPCWTSTTILSGRADAMLGGFLNVEGVDLALRGKNPTVIPVDHLGIPTYDELVLVANS